MEVRIFTGNHLRSGAQYTANVVTQGCEGNCTCQKAHLIFQEDALNANSWEYRSLKWTVQCFQRGKWVRYGDGMGGDTKVAAHNFTYRPG